MKAYFLVSKRAEGLNQVKNMINQIQDKDQVKEVLLQYRDNIVN